MKSSVIALISFSILLGSFAVIGLLPLLLFGRTNSLWFSVVNSASAVYSGWATVRVHKGKWVHKWGLW